MRRQFNNDQHYNLQAVTNISATRGRCKHFRKLFGNYGRYKEGAVFNSEFFPSWDVQTDAFVSKVINKSCKWLRYNNIF